MTPPVTGPSGRFSGNRQDKPVDQKILLMGSAMKGAFSSESCSIFFAGKLRRRQSLIKVPRRLEKERLNYVNCNMLSEKDLQ
ncbi:hypothetical protein CEXT_629511 [Caerostris extrusa]|uniref:Uncharacterized protein n=1 Tax=Caerostris extrusa TaxID=172846 RepID=A0AAV4QMM1_CAEEX|nr:hypothetical protein CEXT_629511 [Caerostris extrusa]